jgi:hypothetical protein
MPSSWPAGYARWLEAQGDDEALAAADRYYDRLRERVVRTGGDVDWSSNWHQLPLWPTRDSDATDALRREVLRHRHTAWYVIREAIRSPRHHDGARQAWLEIAGGDPDASRRRSVVYDMIHEPDTALSVPLLLDALRLEFADRWNGEEIVRHLARLGFGAQAVDRLTSVAADPAISPARRAYAERLIGLLATDMGPR